VDKWRVEPGTLLSDEIRLVAPIAEGAMGTIWKADHLRLGVPVAVKFIHAALAEEAPAIVERFEREAKAVAQLTNTHVVRILDFGLTSQGVPFMAMELLQGQTLAAWLERAGHAGIQDTVRIVTQIASALDEAHSLGLVHRDVKPDNIFVLEADEMRVKLLDFGVAKHTLMSRRLTFHGVMVGTPHYMSPEQIENATEVDARTDLWSLAAVSYECLSGELPFTGETLGDVTKAVREGVFQPITELLPAGAPAALDAWFRHAFARNIEDRFQTARELAISLYAVVDGEILADETMELRALAEEVDADDELSERDTFPEIVTRVPTAIPPPRLGDAVKRVLGGDARRVSTEVTHGELKAQLMTKKSNRPPNSRSSKIATPLPNFEPLAEPASDLLQGAAACARIAMGCVAEDQNLFTPTVRSEIGVLLGPLERAPMSLDALFAFLLRTSWLVRYRFELGRIKTGNLANIRPPLGTAVVAGLPVTTTGEPRGKAVAFVHARAAHFYDPAEEGSWRVPTPGDQIRWFRGNRHVLVVRCGP
jgi:serine/threonine protein kinase